MLEEKKKSPFYKDFDVVNETRVLKNIKIHSKKQKEINRKK